MKTISTFFLLILSLFAAAQNTGRYFYDLKTKSFRIADNSIDEPAAINNLSTLSDHWAVNRNLYMIGSNPTLNPDSVSSTDDLAITKPALGISKYPSLSNKGINQDVLWSASAGTIFSPGSYLTDSNEHTFMFTTTGEGLSINHDILSGRKLLNIVDSLSSNILSEKGQFAIDATSANNLYTFSETPNVADHAELIQDSSRLIFSSFTNIDKAIYKNRYEIESFKFSENILMDDQGNSLSLRTTLFSKSITSLCSAAPGNGGVVTERGIYQTEWKGSDDVSYAILQAPSSTQPTSFILNPSANVSNNNLEGYFIIRSSDDNSFASGILNSSTAFVGFRNPTGTLLTLKADAIETSGVFNTQGLTVFNGDKDELKHLENALAYFISNDSRGSNIQIINESSSANAFAGVTFTQGNISNRIATYSNSNGLSNLNDAFAFESNSPSGMVFAVNSNLNVEPGSIRFMFDSKASVTITAKAISIANALLLQSITEEQMLQLDAKEGTVINNSDRKKLLYNNGKDWFEIQMKPIKISENK